MAKGWKRVYGTLHCPVCGQAMQIPRKQKRKTGHIKTMFCGICGEVRDFIEEERVYAQIDERVDERETHHNA